jgi:hypothetical protein
MKRVPILARPTQSYQAICATLLVAVIALSGSLHPSHAQSRPYPSPSPSPSVTARPSPRPTTPATTTPSPSPTASNVREATGSARCTPEGVLVVEVPGPYGEVHIFVYKNGCRVDGNAAIDLNNGITAGASCTLQVKEMKVDITADLLVKALAPEGIQLGELYLSCRRLHSMPLREKYSCELRFSGPTGKLVREWTWKGNPELVVVQCVGNTTEALQDLMEELGERGIKFKEEHQPGFTTYTDDSGQVRWGFKLRF